MLLNTKEKETGVKFNPGLSANWPSNNWALEGTKKLSLQGRIQDFFLGGGALVSCSTSTSINHIVFFLQNTSCITKPQVISSRGGGGSHPLHPPPRSAPGLLRTQAYFRTLLLSILKVTFPVERSDDRIRLRRSQAEKSVISDISTPLIRHFSLLQLLQRFRLEYHHEPLDLRQKLLTVPDQPVKIKFVDRR